MAESKPTQVEIPTTLGGAPEVKMTEAEFDAHWEKYSQTYPEKYAFKVATGDLERQREKLFGARPVKEDKKEPAKHK